MFRCLGRLQDKEITGLKKFSVPHLFKIYTILWLASHSTRIPRDSSDFDIYFSRYIPPVCLCVYLFVKYTRACIEKLVLYFIFAYYADNVNSSSQWFPIFYFVGRVWRPLPSWLQVEPVAKRKRSGQLFAKEEKRIDDAKALWRSRSGRVPRIEFAQPQHRRGLDGGQIRLASAFVALRPLWRLWSSECCCLLFVHWIRTADYNETDGQ